MKKRCNQGQTDHFRYDFVTKTVKGQRNCETEVTSKRFRLSHVLCVAHLDFSRSIVTPVKAPLFGSVILLMWACLLLVHCLSPFVNLSLLGSKSVWHVVPTWCPVSVGTRARAGSGAGRLTCFSFGVSVGSFELKMPKQNYKELCNLHFRTQTVTHFLINGYYSVGSGKAEAVFCCMIWWGNE